MMKLIMPRSARLFSVFSLAIAMTVAGTAGIGLAEETRRSRPDKGPPPARDERPDTPHDRRRGGPLTPQEITLAFEVMERIDPDTAQAFRLRYEENPDDTIREMQRRFPRMRPFLALKRWDPEMFDLRIEELKLQRQQRDLLADYRQAEEIGDEQLTAELKETLIANITQLYDVRREIRHHELSRLEMRIQRLREELEAGQSLRDERIRERVDQLLSDD